MKNTKPLFILNETILPGERKTIYMEIAKLHTATKLKIPVIIERSKIDGPTVLFSAGIHGDEINGVEIVRSLIVQKINKPLRGTIICIPVVNIFTSMKNELKRAKQSKTEQKRVFQKPFKKTDDFILKICKKMLTFASFCTILYINIERKNLFAYFRLIFIPYSVKRGAA